MGIFKPFLLFILIHASTLTNKCMATPARFPKSASPSWYSGLQKGWLWYKRVSPSQIMDDMPLRKDEQERTPKEGQGYPQEHPHRLYTQRMEAVQKNFEEIQAKAILEPTLQNVQRMQQAQNALIGRSMDFEKMWMLASLLAGQNYRASDQPYPLHRKIYKEQFDRQLDQKIKDLAKSHGLFFLFKKDCSYCEQFAPVVKQLIRIYGFECKAISADGKALALFPQSEMDNGTIDRLNPEGIFPSLFLVNPHSRQVIPLSRGLVNLSALLENFKVIIQSREEGYHARSFYSS